MPYLRYLCLFAYGDVQHMLCFCFLRLVHRTLCCQFLWIVHFWLPLWYFLTFICLLLVLQHFALACKPNYFAPIVHIVFIIFHWIMPFIVIFYSLLLSYRDGKGYVFNREIRMQIVCVGRTPNSLVHFFNNWKMNLLQYSC